MSFEAKVYRELKFSYPITEEASRLTPRRRLPGKASESGTRHVLANFPPDLLSKLFTIWN